MITAHAPGQPITFGIPRDEPTLVPDTCLRITHYGPDVPWKLELVLNDGRLLRDFTLPPAFSIDQRQTMYCYSNRGHPNFRDLLYRLIEFDVKLEWNADGQATVTAVDNTDHAVF
jgi:hypothetical protein